MPVGKLSVNDRLVALVGDPKGFVISIRSSDGAPPVTLTGLNDLLMPMLAAALRVRVAVIAVAFFAPSLLVMLLIGIVLTQLAGDPLVSTSNKNRQFPPASTDAPVKLTVAEPGVADMEVDPAQVVLAFAGLATRKPVGNGSVMARPVSGMDPALLTWIATLDVPPVATALGVNDLVAEMGVFTVSDAVRLELSVAPWSLVRLLPGMVLVYVPVVAAKTLTLKLQLPFAGTVPPDKLTLEPPDTTASTPPQELLAAGVCATTNPAGRLSTKEELVRARLDELDRVTVRTDVPG